jgi:hypothetical protein
MAVVDTAAPATTPPHVSPTTQLGRLLWSEWTKLRTVRSTVWTLLATLLVCIGLPLLFSLAVIHTPRDQIGPDFDPGGFSLFGLFLGQLIIASLGVLVVSAEYSTGTIRATLSATPQRLTMLTAKALVFAAVIAVVAFVVTFVAFLSVQAVLNTHDLGTTLGTSPSLRMVIGGALYLVAVGLMGLGLGTIVRNSAAGITTAVGLLFVLPLLGNFLPHWWQEHVVKYFPGNAGAGIFSAHGDPTMLPPWTGLAVFTGYALLALVVGGLLLRRRDA